MRNTAAEHAPASSRGHSKWHFSSMPHQTGAASQLLRRLGQKKRATAERSLHAAGPEMAKMTPDLEHRIYDKLAGHAGRHHAALAAGMASMACSRVPADLPDPSHLAIRCPMCDARRTRGTSDRRHQGLGEAEGGSPWRRGSWRGGP